MSFANFVSFQGMLINVASFLRLSALSRKSPRENIKTIYFLLNGRAHTSQTFTVRVSHYSDSPTLEQGRQNRDMRRNGLRESQRRRLIRSTAVSGS